METTAAASIELCDAPSRITILLLWSIFLYKLIRNFRKETNNKTSTAIKISIISTYLNVVLRNAVATVKLIL